jgi:subtilisin family serine protease
LIIVGLSACALNVQAGEHPYRAGEIIVKLRAPASENGVPAATSAHVRARAFYSKARGNHHLKVVGSWNGLDLHHMKLDDLADKGVEETIEDLKKLGEVEYAEPNYILQAAQTSPTAFDNQRSQSFSLDQLASGAGPSSQSYAQGTTMTAAAIKAQPQTSPWPVTGNGGQNIPVAVIDTGIDFNHSSFANSIWTNTREIPGNGIDDDGNGYVDDVHGWNFVNNNNNPQDDEGHGTHVSGIVLGVGFNIFAPPNSATNIVIMPLKFLDSNGSGVTTDAIKAIYYASNNGAKVMNNSWGGGPYSQALAEAITYAYNKDVLFVAAAGNSKTNNDSTPSYPASYQIPNVIPVAATDDSDVIASFSNFGTQSVPLSAPGVSVLSTYPGNNSFAYMSGTSMASPFVAGTAALMRYQSQSMNCYQVRKIILNAVDIKGNLSPYVNTSGRLNVLNSINIATSSAVDPYKPSFALQPSSADRGLASNIGGQGGCGLIANAATKSMRLRQVMITLGLILLPVMIVFGLRKKVTGDSRRKFQRYAMNSSVSLKFGDKELVGAVKTISVGGGEINTDALLEQGSVITMFITSPDGQSKIEVQGHVVWSEQQKRYGVAFDKVADAIKEEISQWSTTLPKV